MNTIANTSNSDNQLMNFLYNNLVKLTIDACFRVRYLTAGNTVRAHDAIRNRWRNPENRMDDVGMFLATKKEWILGLGLTIESFEPMTKQAYTVCTAFVNWKINQYEANHTKKMTFENNVIFPGQVALNEAINKWEDKAIQDLEDEMASTARIERLEKVIGEFATKLTSDEKIVWSYIRFPGRDESKKEQMSLACEDLGIKRSAFFVRVEKLRAAFVTYYKANEDI
jgi:hypothetical protein